MCKKWILDWFDKDIRHFFRRKFKIWKKSEMSQKKCHLRLSLRFNQKIKRKISYYMICNSSAQEVRGSILEVAARFGVRSVALDAYGVTVQGRATFECCRSCCAPLGRAFVNGWVSIWRATCSAPPSCCSGWVEGRRAACHRHVSQRDTSCIAFRAAPYFLSLFSQQKRQWLSITAEFSAHFLYSICVRWIFS